MGSVVLGGDQVWRASEIVLAFRENYVIIYACSSIPNLAWNSNTFLMAEAGKLYKL